MNGSTSGFTAIAALTATLWGLAPQGFAQSYPAKPVRIVAGFAAGGGYGKL